MKYFKRENWGFYTAATVIVFLFCLITIILLLNTFISSFKTNMDFFTHPWSLPSKVVFDNYVKMYSDGFLGYFRNSFILLATAVTAVLGLSAPAAYGLGRFKFSGNSKLRLFFMIGMFFPYQLGLIPLFNLIKAMGLMDSLLGVFLIYSATISMPVFILTNLTLTIPEELRESARIDGAGEFKIFTSIFLPLMKPGFGALAPLLTANIWNEFFIPMVFIASDKNKTVTLGLYRYFTSKGFDTSRIGVAFACVCVSVFPLVLIYIFGSKNIISGMTLGSVKE